MREPDSRQLSQGPQQFASADELQGYLSKMGLLDQPEALKQVVIKIEDDFKFHETKAEDTNRQGNSMLAVSGTFLSVFLVALSKMREQPGWNDIELLCGLHLNQLLATLVVIGIVAAMIAALMILRVRKIGRLSIHWLGPLFDRGANFTTGEVGVDVLSFKNLSRDGLLYVVRNRLNQFLQYHDYNQKRTTMLSIAHQCLFFAASMLAILIVKFIFQ